MVLSPMPNLVKHTTSCCGQNYRQLRNYYRPIKQTSLRFWIYIHFGTNPNSYNTAILASLCPPQYFWSAAKTTKSLTTGLTTDWYKQFCLHFETWLTFIQTSRCLTKDQCHFRVWLHFRLSLAHFFVCLMWCWWF